MKYPVHERFHTWQGEGTHIGRRAYFVRLYGCPLHCPWCDSAGTWHKDYVPEHIEIMTAADVGDAAAESGAPFVVVTGGEPGIFDLEPLANALHMRQLEMHVETSGAFPVTHEIDHLVVSPKWAKPPLDINVSMSDDLKIIVEHAHTIEAWETQLGHHMRQHPNVWLHPEWSQRENPTILRAISNAVKANTNYRAGWQLHKLYQVDSLDPGAKPLVPLGGNPDLGY